MKHHKERRRNQFAINGPRRRYLYELTYVLEKACETLVTFRRRSRDLLRNPPTIIKADRAAVLG